MKRLLVIPFFISLAACGPVTEKIEDRTGGCINGKCTTDEKVKPTACGSSFKISSFKGYTFITKEEKTKAGVIYRAQLEFANSNAAFTQYCQWGEDYASPTILSTYSTTPAGDRLKFHEASSKAEKFGKHSCKAALSSDSFKVSYEGLCLVLEDAKGQKVYYERKAN